MIPLFRCSRFRHWVSSSISLSVKVYPPFPALPKPISLHPQPNNNTQEAPGIKLPNPESTTPEDPGGNPVPIPHPLHIRNKNSDAQFVSASSDTFLCGGDGIEGGDGRVSRVGEPLVPRRPERAVTCPLPLGQAMPGPVGCSVSKAYLAPPPLYLLLHVPDISVSLLLLMFSVKQLG